MVEEGGSAKIVVSKKSKIISYFSVIYMFVNSIGRLGQGTKKNTDALFWQKLIGS